MGKPVVATRLPMVEHDFSGDAVAMYPSGDADAMADAILALVDDTSRREAAVRSASSIVATLAWEHASKAYVGLIDRLSGDTPQR